MLADYLTKAKEIKRKSFEKKIRVALLSSFTSNGLGLEVKNEASTCETIEEIAKVYGATKNDLKNRIKKI